MHPALDGAARDELIQRLSRSLASSLDLMLQAKTAHWNVRGRDFIALHELFERIAEHLRKQSDQFAERAVALGGCAAGTVRHVATSTCIPDWPADLRDADSYVQALADRAGAYATELRGALALAAERDAVTEHILADALEHVEHDLWFLEAQLEERPAAGTASSRRAA